MRFRFISLLVVLLALAFGSQAPLTQSAVEIPQTLIDQVTAEGSVRVIVGVRAAFVPEGDLAIPAAITEQRDNIRFALDTVTNLAAQAGVSVETRFDFIPFFVARVDPATLLALASVPGVQSIEGEVFDRPTLAQSVPLVNAPAAWAAGATGAGWNVVIMDTGVSTSHPFLAGKVVAEACFSAAGGATSLCPGGVSPAVGPGTGTHCGIGGCEHGTHVAGIAVGVNGPGGGNGVAPGAGLIAIQVFSRFTDPAVCGANPVCIASSSIDQTAALNAIFGATGAGNAYRIASVNMSLGGSLFTGACDSATGNAARKAAIDNLLSIGIATVIATGNDSAGSGLPGAALPGISSPACISTAVSVGSTTKADGMSSFGNRKSDLVRLVAPGSSITSSIPGGGFQAFNGTSMATPHVAGAWAVLKQAAPTASVVQILAALQSTGLPINDPPSGGVYPRINVGQARLALQASIGIPSAPQNLAAAVAGNVVTFNWTPPASGAPPTRYVLQASLSPSGPSIASINLPAVPTAAQVRAVPRGTYYVRIVAVNAAGPGPFSNEVTVNVAAPAAPTLNPASLSGRSVTLSWSPGGGGAATSFRVVASLSPGGAPVASIAVGATSVVVPAPPGTFFVRVHGVNAVGMGAASNEITVAVP
jgi:subtilisin